MLTLPIKKQWFDMILSGEKKEEYREMKPYFSTRFRNVWGYPAYWREPRQIRLRSGYSKKSPSVVVTCTLSTGKGRPEWGADPEKTYYRLRIENIIPGWEG